MSEEQAYLMYPTKGIIQCPHCTQEFDIEERQVHKDLHLRTQVFYNCLMCGRDILVSQIAKECNG